MLLLRHRSRLGDAHPVTPRPRQSTDLPACVAALRAVHETDGYPHRWPADPETWLSPGEPIGAWVAEDAAELVGHVLLARVPDDDPLVPVLPWAMAEVAEVKRLFVVTAARRRRVGATLLETASAHARALGLTSIHRYSRDGGNRVRLRGIRPGQPADPSRPLIVARSGGAAARDECPRCDSSPHAAVLYEVYQDCGFVAVSITAHSQTPNRTT